MSDYDILAVGDTYFDLIFAGLEDVPRLGTEVFSRDFTVSGGGIFNSVVVLSRLGVKVALATELGSDIFSRHLLDLYRQEGLNTDLFLIRDEPCRYVTAAFSMGNERGFLSFAEKCDMASFSPCCGIDLLEKDIGVRLLHFADLEGGITNLPLADVAHKKNLRITLDCQQMLRTIDDPRVQQLLSLADVFFPNKIETLRLTGVDDLEEAGKILLKYTPLVVVKLGAEGAFVFERGKTPFTVDTIDYGEIIDTTGAGDCFNAGIIYGMLKNLPLRDCITAANICGGLSVTALGGTTALKKERLINEMKERVIIED